MLDLNVRPTPGLEMRGASYKIRDMRHFGSDIIYTSVNWAATFRKALSRENIFGQCLRVRGLFSCTRLIARPVMGDGFWIVRVARTYIVKLFVNRADSRNRRCPDQRW